MPQEAQEPFAQAVGTMPIMLFSRVRFLLNLLVSMAYTLAIFLPRKDSRQGSPLPRNGDHPEG